MPPGRGQGEGNKRFLSGWVVSSAKAAPRPPPRPGSCSEETRHSLQASQFRLPWRNQAPTPLGRPLDLLLHVAAEEPEGHRSRGSGGHGRHFLAHLGMSIPSLLVVITDVVGRHVAAPLPPLRSVLLLLPPPPCPARTFLPPALAPALPRLLSQSGSSRKRTARRGASRDRRERAGKSDSASFHRPSSLPSRDTPSPRQRKASLNPLSHPSSLFNPWGRAQRAPPTITRKSPHH